MMSKTGVFGSCEQTGGGIKKNISMVGSTFITKAFGALSLSNVSQLTEYVEKAI